MNSSPILEDTGENRRAAGGVQESGTDLMRISSTRVGGANDSSTIEFVESVLDLDMLARM